MGILEISKCLDQIADLTDIHTAPIPDPDSGSAGISWARAGLWVQLEGVLSGREGERNTKCNEKWLHQGLKGLGRPLHVNRRP